MLDDEVKRDIQGGYSRFLSANGMKPRLGQKQMIAAIANSLGSITEDAEGCRNSDAGISVIEAGTGTGKTLSYLMAALPIARQKGRRVVVSTGTIALQEQLVSKDIPLLLESTGWQYSFSLAKGRGRYLCPLRLEQCLDAAATKDSGGFLFEDEISFNPTSKVIASYREMDAALGEGTWEGDRDSWPDVIEQVDWQPLTVDRRQCTGRRCRHIRDCCFYKARDNLEEADCIVANHDLVMADLALGGGVILPAPEETIYIFDEGHRMAGTALNHFSGQCRIHTTSKWMEKLQKQLSGYLPHISEAADLVERLHKISSLAKSADKMLLLAYPLFETLLDTVADSWGETRYCFPGGDPGDEIQSLAKQLSEILGQLESLLECASDQLTDAMDDQHFPVPRVDLELLFQTLGIWQGRVESARRLWQYYSLDDDQQGPPHARWVTLEDGTGGNVDIRVSASPTHAASIFKDKLWQRCYGALVTSATLRTLGSFDNFTGQAGVPATANYSVVAGAFDFENSGVLTVPDIGADASDAEAHTDALVDHLPGLIDWKEGTLVLFSSLRQMEQVYDGLPPSKRLGVLMQGRLSNRDIVSRHKQSIDKSCGSVIFGLASFAEGMDFPGDYCRHVIIAKLPFSVPNDPVHATLSEWVENRGGNSFMELMLPEASLRLHQACGRLLRTETDTGRVSILDRRILTKRYGRQLLDDLPPFRRELG